MDVAPCVGDEALEFSELPLSAPLLRGLAEAGFVRPSPIQARAIPLARFGADLIAQAKSGTGKTCVFATAALELVRPDRPGPQALVVAPTREVALQVRDVCRLIGSHLPGLECHAFVGGTPMHIDVRQAGACQLACGTPGRVVGLCMCGAIVPERIQLLVLDEADKLCDAGFEETLGYLLTSLPARKQTLAFSATYPAILLEQLRASMRSPITLSLLPRAAGAGAGARVDLLDPLGLLESPALLGAEVVAASEADGADGADGEAREGELVSGAALLGVRQFYHVVYHGAPEREAGRSAEGSAEDEQQRCQQRRQQGGSRGGGDAKVAEVLRLLDELTFHQALVFCNGRPQAHRLASALARAGFPAAFISGDQPQAERTATMLKMRNFNLRVLVATDLLARGVDFGRVTLVMQLSPPRDLSTYLHRVGRTGRFGTAGLAITLLFEDELEHARALLSQLEVAVPPLPARLGEAEYLQPAQVPPDEAERLGLLREQREARKEGRRGPPLPVERSEAAGAMVRAPKTSGRAEGSARRASAAAAPTRRAEARSKDLPAPPPRDWQRPKSAGRGGSNSGGGGSRDIGSARGDEQHRLEALQRAREIGRLKGLERARAKARAKYGLAPDPDGGCPGWASSGYWLQ